MTISALPASKTWVASLTCFPANERFSDAGLEQEIETYLLYQNRSWAPSRTESGLWWTRSMRMPWQNSHPTSSQWALSPQLVTQDAVCYRVTEQHSKDKKIMKMSQENELAMMSILPEARLFPGA